MLPHQRLCSNPRGKTAPGVYAATKVRFTPRDALDVTAPEVMQQPTG